MKTLEKISLFTPEGIGDMKVLTDEEMQTMIGGYVDGYCYFYCMEYLTSRYQCNSMDVNNYMSAYASTYGFNDLQAGGISDLSRIQAFTASYFNTFTVSMTNLSASLMNGNTILAGIGNKDGSDHAVIITGYDPSTGKYKYHDPSDGKTHSLDANLFRFALGIKAPK